MAGPVYAGIEKWSQFTRARITQKQPKIWLFLSLFVGAARVFSFHYWHGTATNWLYGKPACRLFKGTSLLSRNTCLSVSNTRREQATTNSSSREAMDLCSVLYICIYSVVSYISVYIEPWVKQFVLKRPCGFHVRRLNRKPVLFFSDRPDRRTDQTSVLLTQSRRWTPAVAKKAAVCDRRVTAVTFASRSFAANEPANRINSQ